MKKRLLSAILVIAMAGVMLAGCGSKESSSEDTAAESTEKKEVVKIGIRADIVYSDRIEHSARRFRADLPPFQSNLSALLSTPFRKSSAYLSGYECNDRFSIPPESLFRAL